MTQTDRLILLLRDGPKSLNQILAAPGLAAEYRRCMTDLRHAGYRIVYHRARRCRACEPAWSGVRCPAEGRQDNLYVLEAEPAKVASNGQLVFI